MFAYSTPEIDAFEAMYNAADKSPVLIAADSITSISVITGVEEQSEIELSLYPNPTTNGVVSLAGNDLRDVSSIDVFDLQQTGQVIFQL